MAGVCLFSAREFFLLVREQGREGGHLAHLLCLGVHRGVVNGAISLRLLRRAWEKAVGWSWSHRPRRARLQPERPRFDVGLRMGHGETRQRARQRQKKQKKGARKARDAPIRPVKRTTAVPPQGPARRGKNVSSRVSGRGGGSRAGRHLEVFSLALLARLIGAGHRNRSRVHRAHVLLAVVVGLHLGNAGSAGARGSRQVSGGAVDPTLPLNPDEALGCKDAV